MPVRSYLCLIAGLLVFLQSQTAHAANRYWVGGSGDWFDPAHWSQTEGGPGGAGAPGEDDTAQLRHDGSDDLTITFNGTGAPGNIYMRSFGTGLLTLDIIGGDLQFRVLSIALYDEPCRVVQRGGSVGPLGTFAQLSMGTHGSYQLLGGTLTTTSVKTGSGRFEQYGGQHVSSRFDTSAGYRLIDGGLRVDTFWDGIIQTGGSVVAETMRLNVWDYYNWGGGDLTITARLELDPEDWVTSQYDFPKIAFPPTVRTFNIDGFVLIDQRHVFKNAQYVNLTLGPTSLLVVDPGYSPADEFRSFTNQGLTHVRGEPLVVPAAAHVVAPAGGTVADPTTIYGRVEGIEFDTPVTLKAGGELISPRLRALNDVTTYLEGGTARLDQLYVGPDGARIVQTDADVECRSFFTVTGWGEDGAVYEMNGGRLAAGYVQIVASGTAAPEGEINEGQFIQRGGEVIVTGEGDFFSGTMTIAAVNAGDRALYLMEGGRLRADDLRVGNAIGISGETFYRAGTLEITSATADVEVLDALTFAEEGRVALAPGLSIVLRSADLRLRGQHPEYVADLANVRLVARDMDAEANTIEAGGLDIGPANSGFNLNFGLGMLVVGEGDRPAWIQLIDDFDNRTEDALPEALYVDELVLGAGSILDLNGLNLYYRSFTDLGGTVLLGGGQMTQVIPEPTAAALLLIGAMATTRRR